jgi:hypothetical protein
MLQSLRGINGMRPVWRPDLEANSCSHRGKTSRNHSFSVMKSSILIYLSLFTFCLGCLAAVLRTDSGQQPKVPDPTMYRVVEQSGNHNVWQCESYEKLPSGRVVTLS